MILFLVLPAVMGALALLLVTPLVFVRRAVLLFEPETDEENRQRREDGPRLELSRGPDLSPAFAKRAHP